MRDRAPIVLLAQRGRPDPDIAADPAIAPRTVPRWRNAYLERGLDGMQPRHAPGAPPKLTEDLAPLHAAVGHRGPRPASRLPPLMRNPWKN